MQQDDLACLGCIFGPQFAGSTALSFVPRRLQWSPERPVSRVVPSAQFSLRDNGFALEQTKWAFSLMPSETSATASHVDGRVLGLSQSGHLAPGCRLAVGRCDMV
jgi:hypothetical protein